MRKARASQMLVAGVAQWFHSNSMTSSKSSRRKQQRHQQSQYRAVEWLEDRQVLTSLAYDPTAQAAVRSALLSGVNRVADMGQEGTLAVFGEHAMSVLQDADRVTVVGASDNGVSRIVAATKTGFADFANSSTYDTAQFYRNVMSWVSRGLGTSARVVTDISSARTWLQGQGFTNVTLRSDWENGLGTADVLVTYFSNPSSAQQTAATNFLASGKGMFVGYNGWAFSYAGVTPLTSGGNAVLRQHGLSWTDDVAWSFDGTLVQGTQTGNAALAASVEASPSSFTAAQQTESAVAMSSTFENVPATDPQLVAIRQAVLANASTVIPTPDTPVTDTNELTRLRIESAVLPRLLPNELFVHRTAFSYGSIPANAARVTKTQTFNVSAANTASQWLSTGLYAAPGDVLTITVPAALVNQGWTVKIGSHDDDLSGKSSFGRMPSGTSRDEPITATTLQVGSVFGGMIYLTKPTTSASASASYSVTISNAIEAPYFVLGQTTDADWNATLRNNPAPYAELAASNVIITLHSSDIRALSNPTAVMTYWQTHLAAQDDLVNEPVPRTYAERIDDDLAISAGWMHSGYPVAAYAHNLANMVDSEPGDDWGFFHEFGHNRQSGYWTFSGEGEVTNNILSMRAFDSTGTIPTDGWSDMWSAAGRAPYIQSFINGGRVRNDAGQQLVTFAQLRAGFGWEPFRQFFRQYQTDLAANLPQNDQQERDQWVTRFSNVVGKNLGPFFNAWGFGASTTALNAVSSLPAWSYLEAVNPNPTVSTLKSTAVTFDPRTGFVDLFADPLTVTFNGSPANGTLATNANGSFTYTPTANYSGVVQLPYSIANAHGGTSTGTVTINVVTRSTVGSPIDTDVRMDNPNLNNSLATTLWIDASTTNNQPAQMLLQFANLFGSGANQIPSNAVVTKATLQLQVTDPGGSIKFHRMLRSWSHTDTWNTLVSGIQTDGVEAASTADLTTGSVATGTQVFDLTSSVQAWKAAPATNFGWAIMPTSTNGTDVSSAESATPPTLTVEYYLVAATNNPPVANNDSATTNEDTATTISVLTNDTDPDGNSLGVSSFTQGAKGAVSFSNGVATYTPNANVNGTDSFSYTISDGNGGSATATVSITIAAVNDAPIAGNDSLTLNENASSTVNLLANDSDVEGNALSVTSFTQGAHGTVSVVSGIATYTPTTNYDGTDSFSYSVSDGNGGSATGSVSVTINAGPTTLSLNKSSYIPGEGIVASFTNGAGNEDDWIGIYLVGQTPGTNSATAWYYTNGTRTAGGTLEDGSVTLDAGAGAGNLALGSYFVGFFANDGYSELASRVNFSVVAPPNTPPVANNDSATTNEDTAKTISVLTNDSDADGNALSVSSFTQGSKGTVSFSGGIATYTPNANVNGTDSFSYTISDGNGGSATATVSVTITAVNDAPVAGNDSATTPSGTAVSISVQANDSDIEGSALTSSVVTNPTSGSVVVNANGTISYTSTVGFSGTDTFTYRVSDGALFSNTATVSITVTAVASPKFFTVDSTSDRTFRYQSSGALISSSALSTTAPSNTTAKGVAASPDGSTLWVIDSNKSVYIYNAAGTLLGQWTTSGLTTPTGISVVGSDVWISDSGSDRIYRFANTASLRSGTAAATSSFATATANGNSQDLVTDGTTVWVVNSASTDRVYVYQASNGAQLGYWNIDSANKSPTGITLDPTGASQSLWIADISTDRVYEYSAARSRRSGTQTAALSFALSSSNANVEGIADPDTGERQTSTRAATSANIARTAALPFAANTNRVAPSFDQASISSASSSFSRNSQRPLARHHSASSIAAKLAPRSAQLASTASPFSASIDNAFADPLPLIENLP